jgi:hypothetical protein
MKIAQHFSAGNNFAILSESLKGRQNRLPAFVPAGTSLFCDTAPQR